MPNLFFFAGRLALGLTFVGFTTIVIFFSNPKQFGNLKHLRYDTLVSTAPRFNPPSPRRPPYPPLPSPFQSYETFGKERAVQFVAMATPEDLRANAEYIRMADEVVDVPGGNNSNNYANGVFWFAFIFMSSRVEGVPVTVAAAAGAAVRTQCPPALSAFICNNSRKHHERSSVGGGTVLCALRNMWPMIKWLRPTTS